MTQSIPLFLINLDHSAERLATCAASLAQQNISFERVSAVYGADLTEEDVRESYDPNLQQSHYKRLGLGEIGCYLSHLKLWKKIVDENIPYALIIEDDVTLECNEFSGLLKAVSQLEDDWDYIKLLANNPPKKILRAELIAAEGFKGQLITYSKVPTRTGAQLVSYKGAKKLLATSKPFGRPVDVDLRYWWEKNIVVQGIWPYAFVANERSPSEIDKLGVRKKAHKSVVKKFKNQVKFHWSLLQYSRKLSAQLKQRDG